MANVTFAGQHEDPSEVLATTGSTIMVVEFDSPEQLKVAIDSGQCTFTLFGQPVIPKNHYPLYTFTFVKLNDKSIVVKTLGPHGRNITLPRSKIPNLEDQKIHMNRSGNELYLEIPDFIAEDRGLKPKSEKTNGR